jgi:chemotaxis protein CheC
MVPDRWNSFQREFLLDVSNLLSGAVLIGIGEQLDIEIGFSPPTLIDERVHLDDLQVDHDSSWTHVMFTQVHFQLEEREFSSRLLIFLPDSSFSAVFKAVDQFLDEL